MERVTKFVSLQNGTFEVRFEQGGKKEDRAVLEYAKDLKTIGSPFDVETSAKYDGLSGEDYRKTMLGEPRRRLKENLFVQIADLYLYPMVKRKYDTEYSPWCVFYKNGKVIDAHLEEWEWDKLGIKYSCFDSKE
jgi:hypothetical protein